MINVDDQRLLGGINEYWWRPCNAKLVKQRKKKS